jgi:hypothetical protein
MDYSKTNDAFDFNNFTQPASFLAKLKPLHEKLPSILEDFVKYYVFYSRNPEVNEYQQLFDNIKGNLQSLNSGLFVETNNIEKMTEIINKKLLELDKLIMKEKKMNRELKRRLGIVENTYNGSDEMIHNFKDMYELQYLTNFATFAGIVVLGTLLFKPNNKLSAGLPSKPPTLSVKPDLKP